MSDKDYKELVTELDECQQQMFDRYDLDGSVSKPKSVWRFIGAETKILGNPSIFAKNPCIAL